MSDNHRNNIGWFLAGLSLGAVAAFFMRPRPDAKPGRL